MKRLLLMLVFLSWSAFLFADESEKTSPQRGLEMERKVSVLDIEGKIYYDVVMTMKSNDPGPLSDPHVKIKVKASSGKKIWKKTFEKSYLYVFKGGQIQIGRPNFVQIFIDKPKNSECWEGIVREKEGVYF